MDAEFALPPSDRQTRAAQSGRNKVTNYCPAKRGVEHGESHLRRPDTHSMPIGSSVKRLLAQPVATASQSGARPASIPKKWHAISVDAKTSSCAVAHDLRKKRFLSKEAPNLPLDGCTKRSSCPCTYKHHDDRRNKSRRADGAVISSSAHKHGSERRMSRGRRSED
jgi:hypothetical protein